MIKKTMFLVSFFFAWMSLTAQEKAVLSNIPSRNSTNKMTFRVKYTANQNRDIVVAVKSPTNQHITAGRFPVTTATDKFVQLTVNLPNNLSVANGYTAIATLRPTGGNWASRIGNPSSKKFNIIPITVQNWISIQNIGQRNPSNEYAIRVNYTVREPQDVGVTLRNPNGGVIGSKKIRINPAAGGSSNTAEVLVKLNTTSTVGNNYEATAFVRKIGGTWRDNLKVAKQKFNVVASGTARPDGQPQLDEYHPLVEKAFDDSLKSSNYHPGVGWTDSYEANGYCWCTSSFDHDLGNKDIVFFRVNGVKRNVRDVCDELKKHPRFQAYQVGTHTPYNDIQCGNGPYNTARDETGCPGRTDIGFEGCAQIGKKWDLAWLQGRARFSAGAKSLSTLSNEEVAISLSSNPIQLNREAYLDVTLPESSQSTINIYSLAGQQVISLTSNEVAGVTSSIDLTPIFSALASNQVYVLSYESANFKKVLKVAVQ